MGKKRFRGIDSDLELSFVGSARVFAAANVDIAQLNNADTEDGVVLATNDVIFLGGQTDKTENGFYTVGLNAGDTVRHAAFPVGSDMLFTGAVIRINEGDVYAGSRWTIGTPGDIVVDTTAIDIFRSDHSRKDSMAGEIAMKAITIPDNVGDGSTLDALLGAQSYDGRIVGWVIVENDGAFTYSLNADMTAPAPTIDAELGMEEPLGEYPLSQIYVASTSASTVAAVLKLYLARGDI